MIWSDKFPWLCFHLEVIVAKKNHQAIVWLVSFLCLRKRTILLCWIGERRDRHGMKNLWNSLSSSLECTQSMNSLQQRNVFLRQYSATKMHEKTPFLCLSPWLKRNLSERMRVFWTIRLSFVGVSCYFLWFEPKSRGLLPCKRAHFGVDSPFVLCVICFWKCITCCGLWLWTERDWLDSNVILECLQQGPSQSAIEYTCTHWNKNWFWTVGTVFSWWDVTWPEDQKREFSFGHPTRTGKIVIPKLSLLVTFYASSWSRGPRSRNWRFLW